jgi:hypothetical protein
MPTGLASILQALNKSLPTKSYTDFTLFKQDNKAIFISILINIHKTKENQQQSSTKEQCIRRENKN